MSRQKKSSPPTKLTYSQASTNYGSQAKKYAGNRDVEAQALLKAAKKMQDLQAGWDGRSKTVLEETIKFNRQIWVMFYDNAVMPGQEDKSLLQSSIINMAGFIFKRSIDIISDPSRDKLSILININREVAAGLMAKPLSPAPAEKTDKGA